MIKNALCYVLILATLLPAGFVHADDDAPYRGSIHSQEAMHDRVVHYIEAYNAYTYTGPQLSAEEQIGLQFLPAADAFTKMNDLAIAAKAHKQGHYDRERQKICEAVGGPESNGRTPFGAMLKRLDSATIDVMSADTETYGETVSYLMADYYLQPLDREAIGVLVKCISEKVQPQIVAASVGWDPIYKDMLTGTMIAWGLIAVWDLRGGAKGIKQDTKWVFSKMGEGFGSLVRRVRQEEGLGAELVKAEERSLASRAWQSVRERLAAKFAKAREAWASKGEIIRSVPGALVRKAKGFPLKFGKGVKSLAWDLFRSTPGGLIGAYVGMNEDMIPVKVDPEEALQSMQILIAGEIEEGTRELDGRMTAKPVDADNAKSYFHDCALLAMNAQDLVKAAPELLQEMPWPHLTEDMAVVRDAGWWARHSRRNQKDRVALFYNDSRRLRTMVEKLEKDLNADAKAAGLGATKYVSLGATLPKLMAMAETIAGFLSAKDIEPPKDPSPDEATEMAAPN